MLRLPPPKVAQKAIGDRQYAILPNLGNNKKVISPSYNLCSYLD